MSYTNLITYEKAKKEVEKLQKYINLIDNYEVDSLEKFIIKNYALTNSSSGVIKKFNAANIHMKYPPLSRDYVLGVIKKAPIDELHKIIGNGYRNKYKKIRNR